MFPKAWGAPWTPNNIWGCLPALVPRACPTSSLSHTQTLPGFARETGNFCSAASLG